MMDCELTAWLKLYVNVSAAPVPRKVLLTLFEEILNEDSASGRFVAAAVETAVVPGVLKSHLRHEAVDLAARTSKLTDSDICPARGNTRKDYGIASEAR